jgi:regulator of sigma E protease
MHLSIEFLRSAAAFVVVLGVLVFVHELGHYLAARWRGVHVEAFSIGFGRPFASWTDRLGTQWRLAWLPLGGYVKLHGQERPEEVTEAQRRAWQQGRTFHGKSVLSRAIVVAAGPVANFALAVVLFAGLFAAIGRPVIRPEVGQILPGSAAAQAGLQVGDRIARIDDTSITRFEDIQRIVTARPDQTLSMRVLRGGEILQMPVRTGARTGPDGQPIGVLGIAGGAADFHPVGPLEAVGDGFTQTWTVTAQTFGGIWQMLSGHGGTDDIGGPLRIAQLSGEVAQLGLASLISFIAVLSVNLGLINLFPIPVLDGGHLLFYLAEAVRGRPIPPRAQDYGYRAGFALLASLFLFATWNDLAHLGIFRWVAALIG